MTSVPTQSPPSIDAQPARQRKTLIERLISPKMAARASKHAWGPLLPITSRMSPKLISRVAATLGPDDFARSIAAASDEQLEAAMASKLRGVVLDEIVRRMELEFQPDRAAKLDTVIYFKIDGRPDGGSDLYQVAIRDSTCKVCSPPTEDATVTIELGAVDFLKMTSGVISGIDLYLGRKLKFDGAAMMLTRLTSIFNIPSAAA